MGEDEYGDAVLCELGTTSVLIDGAHPGDEVSSAGHPSIPEQIATLLGEGPPIEIDLLVVTHGHQDHIGCLPALVATGTVRPRWALVADPKLAWGRSLEHDAMDAGPTDPVLAALREEVPSAQTDDRRVAEILADAVSLEQRYTEMLARLSDRGTRVVRYGRDPIDGIRSAFRRVGLRILGPSQPQLLLCAQIIEERTRDAADQLDNLRTSGDAPASDVELYRELVRSSADLVDATSRPGPAINLQSVVTRFSYRGVKLLFAGDMQFADAQTGGADLQHELDALLAGIRADAPYDLAKLSHHGSDNAFDENVLDAFGSTALYGICAGTESKSHPNARVLDLLNRERDRLKWVRTDRNGLSTIEFRNGTPSVHPARGRLNDARPNVIDAPAAPATSAVVRTPVQTAAAPAAVTAPAVGSRQAAGGEPVDVFTRVPPGTRVTLTIDTTETQAAARPRTEPRAISAPADAIRVAPGRSLPPLLVVTSAEQLAVNVGLTEADRALSAVRAHPSLTLYDELPPSVGADATGAAVADQLARDQSLAGVVILGGLDVVPAHRRDCLPPRLRDRLGRTTDPDDFVVWSDDSYGDRNASGPVPVSRIPDAQSPELLFAALGASDRSVGTRRMGVRNFARPFAESVFERIAGTEQLLVSEPEAPASVPPLAADHVYLMLHGDYLDQSRFVGEDASERYLDAVDLTNVPAQAGRVVFVGCCWGALTATLPAYYLQPAATPAPLTVGSSLALSFLSAGATAFVGCTGVHYSPAPPGDYYGGPMHKGFFDALDAGRSPAEALLDAKRAYLQEMPHGRTSPLQQAIEFKILNQFTCLGLGW